MSTVEKLFLDIFERKNRIIQQVKQQTDLYNQHLVSKCLVKGITPPPWLLNDSQSSEAPKELSKDDLISELLLPHPQPTIRFPSACCSLYNKPVAPGDNQELVDGISKETYSYNRCYNTGDEHAIAVTGHENNMVPELDVSITSPQDETEVRISNIYSVRDQSVARIRRSKSRQKALELRSSAKAETRSRLIQKNDPVSSPARNRPSLFSSEQDQVMDLQVFGEPCAMKCESGGLGARAGDCRANKEEGTDTCVARILRSRFSSQQQPSFQNEAPELVVSTGIITRSRSSGRQPSSVKDFVERHNFTDKSQKNEYSTEKCVQGSRQCADFANASLKVIHSDVTAESGGLEAWIEDCWGRKEKGTDTCVTRNLKSSFSRQPSFFLNDAPEMDLSIHSAMVDGRITSQSNYRSTNNFLEVTKGAVGLFHERMRSQYTSGNSNPAHHRDTRSISGAAHNSRAAEYDVQNSLGGQVILPCPDTRDVVNQQGNLETVIGDEPVKDQPANSKSVSNDPGLECLFTRSSLDYSVYMEPKQLVFDDTEECDLKDKFSLTVEYKRLEKSPDKLSNTSLDPALLLDYQVSSGDMIYEKPSTMEQEVPTKEDEVCRDSFESKTKEYAVQIKKKKSNVQENAAVGSETVLHVPSSKFTSPAIVQPHAFENPDTKNHVKLYSGEVCEGQLQKEGDYSCKGQEKSTCTSHPFESKHFSTSDFSNSEKEAIGVSENCLIREVGTLGSTSVVVDATGERCLQGNQNLAHPHSEHCSENVNNMSGTKILEGSVFGGIDLLISDLVGSPLGEHENLDLSKSREVQIIKESVAEGNLGSVKAESWPRSKRRKIQDQETDCFSASPSFRVKSHYPSKTDSTSTHLKKVGDDVGTVPGYASPVNVGPETKKYQKMACQFKERIESSPKLQSEESALNSEELGGCAETSSSSELKQLGEPIVSNVIGYPARVSQQCLTEEIHLAGTSVDARKDTDGEKRQLLLHHEGEDNFAYSECLMMERSLLGKSCLGLDGQLSHGLVCSPPKKDRNFPGADETMPALEGFIIDPETENEEVSIPGHGINFNKLKFSSSSIERASILEQICKSTIMQSPLMQFSSALKLHGAQKFCHSVPNGLLECIDLRSISALNEDVDKQLSASYMDNANGHLQTLSYSDYLPCSGARFPWDSQNTYTSPVGKLWERMSLHTGSSEKQLSSNPELTCFPIEEDPSSSEENDNASEVTQKIQEDIGSLIDTCEEREPLADITEANARTSSSAAEKFVNRASADSVNAEVSFKGTHKKVKKLQNYSRNKSEKENDTLLTAANEIEKAKKSTNSFSKIHSSCKASLKTERQKFSVKEPKRSNIVSNVTSFIPLVQQKQAALVSTGKRDIKVRALEAAEAAKRLEEKRQNEREMRKEALKLERARMKQENMRQMELNKKKKEEERKKRDADIVAKKRLREEEERKEKERKKRRIEEAWRLQREEGALCSQKAEKEKQASDNVERDYKTMESDNLLKNSQNMVEESRNLIALQKPETTRWPDEFTAHFQQAGIPVEACGTSCDSYQHQKATSPFDKFAEKDNLIGQKSPEKSYDISPYQCSDEEEEEENQCNKKFIPSWASKNCVALVIPLQQRVEQRIIFPPKSFSRVDEVCTKWKAKKVINAKGEKVLDVRF